MLAICALPARTRSIKLLYCRRCALAARNRVGLHQAAPGWQTAYAMLATLGLMVARAAHARQAHTRARKARGIALHARTSQTPRRRATTGTIASAIPATRKSISPTRSASAVFAKRASSKTQQAPCPAATVRQALISMAQRQRLWTTAWHARATHRRVLGASSCSTVRATRATQGQMVQHAWRARGPHTRKCSEVARVSTVLTTAPRSRGAMPSPNAYAKEGSAELRAVCPVDGAATKQFWAHLRV